MAQLNANLLVIQHSTTGAVSSSFRGASCKGVFNPLIQALKG